MTNKLTGSVEGSAKGYYVGRIHAMIKLAEQTGGFVSQNAARLVIKDLLANARTLAAAYKHGGSVESLGARPSAGQTPSVPISQESVTNKRLLALVIGNKDYDEKPLTNPVNDAEDIHKVLEQLGFEVMLHVNADQKTMEAAVQEFGRRLHSEDIGLFYFSGHGVQQDGSNFLIPVKARVNNKIELKNRTLDVGVVLDEMEAAGKEVNIVILDACRDSPFRGFRSASQGLATMSGPRDFLIAFATAPGAKADDNRAGRNGLYTKHLLKYLVQPGLTIEAMLKRVGEAVSQDTANEQIPWFNSSLYRDFCFAGCGTVDLIRDR